MAYVDMDKFAHLLNATSVPKKKVEVNVNDLLELWAWMQTDSDGLASLDRSRRRKLESTLRRVGSSLIKEIPKP